MADPTEVRTGGSYAELRFADRDELVGYMRHDLTAELITFHQAHHPEIEVTGDRARRRWYLHDKVLVPAFVVKDVRRPGMDVQGRNRVRRLTPG